MLTGALIAIAVLVITAAVCIAADVLINADRGRG